MAAVCPADYSWARNKANLDPCALASRLLDICSRKDSYYLPVIEDGVPYKRTAQDVCSCSSPVYALVSACDDCQHVSFPSWAQWSSGCPNTYTDIPASWQNQYGIPQWAVTNSAIMPSYNPDQARSIALALQGTTAAATAVTPTISTTDAPDSTPTSSPTSTQVDTSSAVATNTASSTPDSNASSTSTSIPTSFDRSVPSSTIGSNAAYSIDVATMGTASGQDPSQPTGSSSDANSLLSASKKSNKKGAIAGGTVGALILLALLAAAAFWLVVRRRRSRMAPSAMYKARYGSRPPTSMSTRPLGDQSTLAVSSFAHNNSSSNVLHDEESHGHTPLVSYVGPRYSHVPQDSASEPHEKLGA